MPRVRIFSIKNKQNKLNSMPKFKIVKETGEISYKIFFNLKRIFMSRTRSN